MRILTNEKVKALFLKIAAGILIYILTAVLFFLFLPDYALPGVFAAALSVMLMIILCCWRYFCRQDEILENAAEQITEYIAGNLESRIECDEEGELYKLFHRINALASILSARAENEGKSREFLKDTISNISHQLKTPISALNIYNGIIQEAEELPTVREFTDLSERELDRMEDLVQNLLKIAKLDAGTIVPDKTPENVADMMTAIEKQFIFRAEQEGKILFSEGEEDIILLCDRIWVAEAIGNIIKNALDHTRTGDTVRISWKRFSSVIQIRIEDNGSGIHPEDRYHIFKRFYRSRFSKDTRGVGLGLPLAKAVIEAHNGTVEVDSTLGKGTAFIINFLI